MTTKYWVGGTGNWDSTTTHWSLSSGGAGGAAIPGTGDDVIFNTASSAANAAYTVTIVTVAANCRSLTIDGPDPADATKVTFAGGQSLFVYGSLNISGGTAGVTWTHNGVMNFYGTGTITTNGVTIASSIGASSGCTITTVDAINCTAGFQQAGGSWTLGAGFTCTSFIVQGGTVFNSATYPLTCTTFQVSAGAFTSTSNTINCTTLIQNGGSLSLGSTTVNCTSFDYSNITTAKILNLGTATINCTGSWSGGNVYANLIMLNFSGASATINCGGGSFAGGSLEYGTVTLTSAGPSITGYNTFANLTWTGTASPTNTVSISHDITVTGTLTLNGNSNINRALISSGTGGCAVKISASTVVTQYCDFMDITGIGSSSWNLSGSTGGAGDCQGNTGITFSTPVDQHWVGGGADLKWSTVGNWTSRIPLPQDNVFMNYAFGTSQTITSDMPRMGKTIDWTGATWTTSLTYTSTIVQRIFGGLILISGLTYTANTQVLTIMGRGSYSLNSNGVTIEQQLSVVSYGGTYTMTGNFTTGVTRVFGINNGTFDTGAYVLSCGNLSCSGGTASYPCTIKFNTGTHLMTGTGSCISFPVSAYLFIPTTAYSLKITDTSATTITLQLSPIKVNSIWFARGNSAAINSIQASTAGIIGELKDTGTAAHTLQFQAVMYFGFDTFVVSGSAGKLVTLQSGSAGRNTTLLCKSGTINCDYLAIRDTLVGGGATWNAGSHSTWTSGGNYFGTGFGWADAPDSAKKRYWVPGGTGNWTSTTNWSLTSGGASGASVPNGNTVYFDSNSGSGTVTIDTFSAYVGDIDCTGFAGKFAITNSSYYLSPAGSIKFVSGMNWDSYLDTVNKTTMSPSGSYKTLDLQGYAGGISFQGLPKPLVDAGFTNDKYTLLSNWTARTVGNAVYSVNMNSGVLDANGYNITVDNVTSINNTLPRGFIMGSGTWTVTGTGAVWNVYGANNTVDPGTSTIKISTTSTTAKTFAGGGMTYNNIVFEKSPNITINDSNTFNNITIADNLTSTITLVPGTTTSFNSLTVNARQGGAFSHVFTANDIAYLRPLTGSFSVDYVAPVNICVVGVGYMGGHSTYSSLTKNVFWTTPSTVVAGQVTNSGTGVSGAIVRLVRQEDNMEVGTTTTDGSGNYSFYADASKLYHVFVEYESGGTKYNTKSLWNITPV